MSESYMIGTAEDCDIRVSDPYVSNYHCRIVRNPDGLVYVEDLGSMNGTWIDGRRVWLQARISADSVLKIGRTVVPLKGSIQFTG